MGWQIMQVANMTIKLTWFCISISPVLAHDITQIPGAPTICVKDEKTMSNMVPASQKIWTAEDHAMVANCSGIVE